MDKIFEHHSGVPRWILKEPKKYRDQWWAAIQRLNAIRLQNCVRGWLARKAAVPRKEPGGKMYWGGILDPKCDSTARWEFATSDNTPSENGVEEMFYAERENRKTEYAKAQYANEKDNASGGAEEAGVHPEAAEEPNASAQ